MRKLFFLFLINLLCVSIKADIAPSPIVVKGIYTKNDCKIKMKSEIVSADLFNDSAKVECVFEMLNYGDSITIEIGFPEMNFQYWAIGNYGENDKKSFKIFVDGNMLTEDQIGVPKEMAEIYDAYMKVYSIEKEYKQKFDSINRVYNVKEIKDGYKYESKDIFDKVRLIQDSLYKWRDSQAYLDSELWKQFDYQMKNGNYPWYIWKVHFEKNETKVIKVSYSLPSGMGYGANYRYFKYILETGSGWFENIEEANIVLKLHDISLRRIEEIYPKGFTIDKSQKMISWNFRNIEPTKEDDIYVQYYNQKERISWKNRKLKWKLSKTFRFLNPSTWQ